jgi:DNA-directed RNA polymerase sigma subunit (sigma70/sigma32)
MNKIYVTTGAVATETKSVKKYMADIKKPKLLTREQEADATRDQLIESNLRFVVHQKDQVHYLCSMVYPSRDYQGIE